jgi:hypothetical protein
VKIASNQEFRVLAAHNGWSVNYARGRVEGETYRLQGKRPSRYALMGFDDYCVGFRAGYYDLSHVRQAAFEICPDGIR